MAGVVAPVQAGAVAAFGEVLVAAVVAVGEQVVVDVQAHPVGAGAQGQGQGVAEVGVGLHEHAAGGGGLVLVGGQAGDLAVRVHRTAPPVVALLVRVHAHQEAVRQAERPHPVHVLQAHAVEQPLIVDQAAAGERQLLGEIALRDEGAGAQLAAQAAVPVEHAEALLADFLAGVQQVGKARRLVPVLFHLGAGQAARVLSRRGVHGGEKELDVAVLGERAAHPRSEQILLHLALLALALIAHAGEAQVVMVAAVRAAQLQVGLAEAVAAAGHAEALRVDQVGAAAGGHVHHAAAGVAVQHRRRPAQHGQGFQRVQVDGVHLGLAVGQGFRKTVHVEAQAAHPERRPRPKTAAGQAQALGEVVAVLQIEARHPRQALVQLQAGLALLGLLRVHHRGGAGQVGQVALQARAAHGHRVQPVAVVGRRFLGRRQRRENRKQKGGQAQ